MAPSSTTQVQATLDRADVHDEWKNSHRDAANERFFEMALRRVVGLLGAPENATILDAGCGSGTKSFILASLGLSVTGADLSTQMVEEAQSTAEQRGLNGAIRFQREDLMALSLADETFDYILCWGVLMHIPDVIPAIAELDRVLKKNGKLIISEGNMGSLQSVIHRNAFRILGKGRRPNRTDAGMEFWKTTSAGELMTREANLSWLIRQMEQRGFTLEKRLSGQFTVLFTKLRSGLLRSAIHRFNEFWFRFVGLPSLAVGNLLIFSKNASP